MKKTDHAHIVQARNGSIITVLTKGTIDQCEQFVNKNGHLCQKYEEISVQNMESWCGDLEVSH